MTNTNCLLISMKPCRARFFLSRLRKIGSNYPFVSTAIVRALSEDIQSLRGISILFRTTKPYYRSLVVEREKWMRAEFFWTWIILQRNRGSIHRHISTIIRSFGVEIFPILGICRIEMKQVKFYREKDCIFFLSSLFERLEIVNE